MCFFLHIGISSVPAGLFPCSRLRGMQRDSPNTTAQAWALAGVRGTCSRRSKSRNLASYHGEASEHISHPGPCKPTHRLTKCLTGCAYRSEFCERLALIASAAYYNYACVDHCYACSVMIYACIRFVCALFSYSTTVQQQSHSKFAWNRCIGISYMLYV